MSAQRSRSGALMLAAVLAGPQVAGRAPGKPPLPPALDQLKKDVIAAVEARRDVTQQMVDSLFSFSDFGFQEIETERYITAILEKNGYYFRENDHDRIKAMWEAGDAIARGAAMMTGTTVESRVLGSAWPGHGNRALAEAMHANIRTVGAPPWSEADQQFARAVQRTLGVPEHGLITEVSPALTGTPSIPDAQKTGGASDDIGDVMWSVPTVTLAFPSNIAGTTAHHWTAAIAMATPVAHKGATQGAKVHAMTVLDLMTRPDLVKSARDEPSKYKSYLEQLGVPYPTPSN